MKLTTLLLILISTLFSISKSHSQYHLNEFETQTLWESSYSSEGYVKFVHFECKDDGIYHLKGKIESVDVVAVFNRSGKIVKTEDFLFEPCGAEFLSQGGLVRVSGNYILCWKFEGKKIKSCTILELPNRNIVCFLLPLGNKNNSLRNGK
jgi:hypothetical protein